MHGAVIYAAGRQVAGYGRSGTRMDLPPQRQLRRALWAARSGGGARALMGPAARAACGSWATVTGRPRRRPWAETWRATATLCAVLSSEASSGSAGGGENQRQEQCPGQATQLGLDGPLVAGSLCGRPRRRLAQRRLGLLASSRDLSASRARARSAAGAGCGPCHGLIRPGKNPEQISLSASEAGIEVMLEPLMAFPTAGCSRQAARPLVPLQQPPLTPPQTSQSWCCG